jgi:hypothetical protein
MLDLLRYSVLRVYAISVGMGNDPLFAACLLLAVWQGSNLSIARSLFRRHCRETALQRQMVFFSTPAVEVENSSSRLDFHRRNASDQNLKARRLYSALASLRILCSRRLRGKGISFFSQLSICYTVLTLFMDTVCPETDIS